MFGFKGGDPRYKILMIMERDKLRRDYYLPAKKRALNIKVIHKTRIETAKQHAREIRLGSTLPMTSERFK